MIEAIADTGEGIEGLSVVSQSDLEQADDIELDDVDIDIQDDDAPSTRFPPTLVAGFEVGFKQSFPRTRQ